jgi:glutathionylspermidine synthase
MLLAEPAARRLRASSVTCELRCGRVIEAGRFDAIKRSMALEHHKWDAQVGDVAALAPFPVVLSHGAWAELTQLASALASETVAIETELASRPELHAQLGLPRELERVLGELGRERATPAASRIMRFDFHPTHDGWRVSEVNSDAPGGFTEAHHFTTLVAEHTIEGVPTGDPAGRWVESIARTVGSGATVVLLNAPGWVQDAQVVTHLAARLRERGLGAHRASPHHLRWDSGYARLDSEFASTGVDAIVRFYQADWIARLGCEWRPLFVGGRTPVSNPAYAAWSESKRLPLLWRELDARTATWRRLLCETLDPRAARRLAGGDWVLKPAFGNEGDDVAVAGAMSRAAWLRRVLQALAQPRRWVAQRRFHAIPLPTPLGPMNVCIGVYVVDGEVSGAYGRLSPSAVIDFAAVDAAVLVANEPPEPPQPSEEVDAR